MDYISRKISSFIPSSSPPAASTNKRKASTLSNTEDPHATNNQKSSKASSSFGAPAHKRRAITLSDTEDQPPTNNHKAVKFSSVVSSSHGYRSPAIPQQRREDFKKLNEASRTTVLERALRKPSISPLIACSQTRSRAYKTNSCKRTVRKRKMRGEACSRSNYPRRRCLWWVKDQGISRFGRL